MRAMILAAGLGTRLRPLTDRVPKPLLPIGLDTGFGRWARWLSAHGVREVVVNLHHLGDRVRRWADDHPVDGIAIRWSEEPEILGTGGGVRKALRWLGDRPFLIVNADVVADPDLEALRLQHERHAAVATLLVRPGPDAHRLGAVEIDPPGRVRRLLGTPADVPGPLEACSFTGVQLVDPRSEPLLPERGCIVRTLHRRLVDGAGPIAGARHLGPWYDVGSLEGHLAANLALAGDGVLKAEDAVVEAEATVTGPAVLGAGCRVRAGASVRRAVVWPGAEASGVVQDAVVTPWATFPVPTSGPG